MSVLSFINKASSIIDKLVPDKTLANQIKGQLSMAGASVIQSETAGNWLQKGWRPATMLTFVFMVFTYWMGWTGGELKETVVLRILDLIKLGLGGYVVGRSAEKVLPGLIKAITNR